MWFLFQTSICNLNYDILFFDCRKFPFSKIAMHNDNQLPLLMGSKTLLSLAKLGSSPNRSPTVLVKDNTLGEKRGVLLLCKTLT